MLTRFATAALVAGIAAGIVVAGMQEFTTTPLIIEAERYENAAGTAAIELAALEDGGTAADAPLLLADSGHGEDGHGEEEWAPADGFERTLFTSISAVGTSRGF